MEDINYWFVPQVSSVEEQQGEGDAILEVNAAVVAEPLLCLHKQEEYATKMGVARCQEETYLKEIQYQEEMNSYTRRLSALYVTVMDTFNINAQIKKQKKLLL